MQGDKQTTTQQSYKFLVRWLLSALTTNQRTKNPTMVSHLSDNQEGLSYSKKMDVM